MMMPIVLYAPAIALSQMIQIPVLACTTLIGGICILYTTIVSSNLYAYKKGHENMFTVFIISREDSRLLYGQTLCRQH